MAQALLGLAAEPLDAVQQRKSGQRSGVLGRRPVEKEKNEKRNAGQQSEPFDCHTSLPGRLRKDAPLLRAREQDRSRSCDARPAHASRSAMPPLTRD